MENTKPAVGSIPPRTERIAKFLAIYAPHLAFGPAISALLGSLYYSEVAHFIPCELCWYQRILMYPLAALILVGVFNEDWLLPRYVLPLSISGIGVSTYHYLLQMNIFETTGVCSGGVSCALSEVNIWGFMTIPFMALIAFTLITVLMLGMLWALKSTSIRVESDEEE